MKKIIRLTESDLAQIVKRTIKEMDEYDYTADDAMDEIGSYIQMVGCSEGRSRLLDDLSRMVDEAERELSEEEFDKLQDYVYDLEQDIYETCSDEEEEESFYESDITRIVKRVIDEGKLDKSTKEKDLDVKMDGFRDKIKNYLKSKDCTVKQVGTDFEIHCDKKHVGQVMFRRDHITVKNKGNKFGKDFGFDEMGRIKAELNKVIRLTESDLTRIVKRIIVESQSTGSYSIEKVHELPNKPVEEIIKMIKSNQIIRSGGRIIRDEPTQLVFSNVLRVDNAELKKSGLMPLAYGCWKGTYDFDITFLVKEAKIKIVIDNFRPNELNKSVPGAGTACSTHYQNFGVVGQTPPTTSKLSPDGASWKQLVQLMEGNLIGYMDEIISSLDSKNTKDPYDFK